MSGQAKTGATAASARSQVVGRWHTQTLAGGSDVPPEERGDCLRACITSILGLPLHAVDNAHGEQWWALLRGDLHRHGYDIAILDMRCEMPMDAYWLATVPSLNLRDAEGNVLDHCVVARGYTLIHDPAMGKKYEHADWQKAWDDDAVQGWALVPLDPAQLLATATAVAPASASAAPPLSKPEETQP